MTNSAVRLQLFSLVLFSHVCNAQVPELTRVRDDAAAPGQPLTNVSNTRSWKLQPVIEKTTGRRVYADYWGPSPIREIDSADGVDLLGTMMALGQGGTNLDMRLVLAFVAKEANGSPLGMDGTIIASVSSNTNELDRKNIFGRLHESVVFSSQKTNYSALSLLKHASEALGNQRTFFVYEVNLKIHLQKRIRVAPEYIHIIAAFPGELDDWTYTRETIPPEERPTTLQLTSAIPDPRRVSNSQNPLQNSPPAPKIDAAAQREIEPVPDLRISISRDGEFFIITCSPKVDRALLEQADLNSSPLQWRPLQPGSNYQSRWYVPPDDGARAFRLRIPH